MPINHKQNKALGFCAFLLLTIALLFSFTGLAEQVIAGEGPVTWSSEDDWEEKAEEENIFIDGDQFQLKETAGFEKAWSYDTGGNIRNLAVDQDHVYAPSWSEEVHKIDAKTGEGAWDDPYDGHDNYVEDVAVHADHNAVYSGSRDDTLHRIDMEDGTQKWEYGLGSTGRGVAVDQDGNVYAGTWNRELYKISPEGAEQWVYDEVDRIYGLEANEYIYAGDRRSRLHKVNPEDGTQEWEYNHGRGANNVEGVAVDEEENYVYTGVYNNTVHKIKAESGENVWIYEGHGSNVHGVAVDEDGFVYSASADNEVHKISPDGENVWVYDGHNGTVSGVAVDAENNVYSGGYDDGEVHKIEQKSTSSGHLLTASKSMTESKPDISSLSYTLNGESITLEVIGSPEDSPESVEVELDGQDAEELDWGSAHKTFQIKIILETESENTPIFDAVTLGEIDEDEEGEDGDDEDEEESEEKELEITQFEVENTSNRAWSRAEVTWAVQGNDLKTVKLEMMEDDEVMDSKTIDVSGSEAEGVDELRSRDGGSYVVITVTDESGGDKTAEKSLQ